MGALFLYEKARSAVWSEATMILLGSGWHIWLGHSKNVTWGKKIIVRDDYFRLLACSPDQIWNALYFEPSFDVEDDLWKALK